MAASKRSIFRNKALKQYAQSREKDILPRFVAPPVFLFLWLLLGLLLISVVVAWLGQIPTFAAGSGVVLKQDAQSGQVQSEATAVIFVPAAPGLNLRAGMPVLLQVGNGQQIRSQIETVAPGVLSPNDAQQKYALNGALSQVITRPSIAVTVKLGSTIPVQTYAGSIVDAQVQVGTRHVLSLLPGLNALIGG
ncbi:MAG: hypothetical protein ACJ8BW_16600 [Ktedonobacteraceae bacterium]